MIWPNPTLQCEAKEILQTTTEPLSMNAKPSECAELVLRCARNLMYEDAVSGYYHTGSGFIALHKGVLYFVTAKHCVKRHDKTDRFDLDSLCICVTYDGSARDFFSVDRCYTSDAQNAEGADLDYADVCIFRIKKDSVHPDLIPKVYAFDIAKFGVKLPNDPAIVNIFIRGYPAIHKSVDDDTKKLTRRAIIFDARFHSLDGEPHVYVLNQYDRALVVDPDGLSGSMSLTFYKNAHGALSCAFSGMVIRSGEGSPHIRVVGADVILHALELASTDTAE